MTGARLAAYLAAALLCAAPVSGQVPDSIQSALRFYESPVSPLAMVMARSQVFAVDTANLTRYEPPEQYDAWWDEVMECSKLGSEINIRVAWSWIETPGDAFTIDGNGPFGGWTSIETHAVLVLSKYKYTKRLIQHEMVHVLMHENNVPKGHNLKYFAPCGLQNQ